MSDIKANNRQAEACRTHLSVMKKVGFISLGCPKNLVDSEVMMGQLKQNGYEITSDANEADTLVVNTCGFIDSAKQNNLAIRNRSRGPSRSTELKSANSLSLRAISSLA